MRNRSLASRLAALALVAVAGLGLTAFQLSGVSSSESSPANVHAPDTMHMDDHSSDVSVEGTLETLEKGLTNIGVQAAAQNISGWQERLKKAESGSTALESISADLAALKYELKSESINGKVVGNLLVELGEQTSSAASAGPDNLETLGETLRTAGQKLAGKKSGGQGMN